MRIISGAYKGRRLKSPPKTAKVRPTTDRVRETLFNLLSNMTDMNDATVLDLFCGTGSLGLECLSRGASEVTFVDLDVRTATGNVELVGGGDAADIIKSDALRYLKRAAKRFDIVFADPPYSFDEYDKLIDGVSTKTGLFILEHSSDIAFDRDSLKLRKDFGETALTFFEFEN